MKASITIHVETLWTNRAQLGIEAELDNPHSETNKEVISMMFATARLLAGKAHGENERVLCRQKAIDTQDRGVDEPGTRLDERNQHLAARATGAIQRDRLDDRTKVLDFPARERVGRTV